MCILCDPSVNLGSLTTVHCRGCSFITSIPPGLINLESLDCSGCINLTFISPDMINLEQLWCYSCPLLVHIPSSLRHIHTLSCDDCPLLTFISYRFYPTYLWCNKCPLLYIHSRLRRQFPELHSSSNILRIRSAQIRVKKSYKERIRMIGVKISESPLYPVRTVMMEYIKQGK